MSLTPVQNAANDRIYAQNCLIYAQQQDPEIKAKVSVFGVRGNKFVLITTEDSFITRIWNQFLKLLGFIKTDDKSINTLYTESRPKPDTKLFTALSALLNVPAAAVVPQNDLAGTIMSQKKRIAKLGEQLKTTRSELNKLKNPTTEKTTPKEEASAAAPTAPAAAAAVIPPAQEQPAQTEQPASTDEKLETASPAPTEQPAAALPVASAAPQPVQAETPSATTPAAAAASTVAETGSVSSDEDKVGEEDAGGTPPPPLPPRAEDYTTTQLLNLVSQQTLLSLKTTKIDDADADLDAAAGVDDAQFVDTEEEEEEEETDLSASAPSVDQTAPQQNDNGIHTGKDVVAAVPVGVVEDLEALIE